MVRSRPAAEKGTEYAVTLDWTAYDAATTVEEVRLHVHTATSTLPPGTDITIEDLKRPLTRAELERLARTLILLSDPFQETQGFRTEFTAPGLEDLSNKIKKSYFGDAEYHLRAVVDASGQSSFQLLDWKDEVLADGKGKPRSGTVPAVFDLWVYLLDKKSFSTRSSTIAEVREWLSIVGGVHVFEGPIRVPPYGERGVDWLEMNLRRAQSPEERPSTNTTIGKVVVDNTSGRLEQKTDRVGYIENETFNELRDFAKEAMDWLARYRLNLAERRRNKEREEANSERQSAAKTVDEILEQLPQNDSKPLKIALSHLVAASERQERRLRDDLQLYRSLATAGMTSAVFAHEIGKPLGTLVRTLPAMVSRLPEAVRDQVQPVFQFAINAATRLESYVSLPLALLKKEKRRPGRVDLVSSVSDIIRSFELIFANAGISIEVTLPSTAVINGSISLVEGIMANLFANSIAAFERDDVDQTTRKIYVSVTETTNEIFISVSDNAGGIKGVDLKEIWLPGVTTSPEGTGFGLTIVRDSVADLGGTIGVNALTDDGGAEFRITLQRPNV